MKRLEFKYLVPLACAEELRQAIHPFVERDAYAEVASGEYTVRSIYLDTRGLRAYLEKVEGIRNRRKLRIRGYGCGDPSDLVYLEIKRREGMPLVKTRAPVRYSDLPFLFTSGDVDAFVQNSAAFPNARTDARRFLFHMLGQAMRPIVNVIYEREAFVGRFDAGVRVTFDKNLRSTLFPAFGDLYDEHQTRYVQRKHFILEIKCFGQMLPAWARDVVRRMEVRWRALSKYTLSLEAHSVPIDRLQVAARSDTLLSLRARHTLPSLEEPTWEVLM